MKDPIKSIPFVPKTIPGVGWVIKSTEWSEWGGLDWVYEKICYQMQNDANCCDMNLYKVGHAGWAGSCRGGVAYTGAVSIM